jgi:hypothetical protein
MASLTNRIGRLRHTAVRLVLLLIPLTLPAVRLDAQAVDEYRLKAAVLYNFAKFVEWPADAFTKPDAPLVVCVLGLDPFGPALDDTLRGHAVGAHPALVRRIGEVTPGCHVLFVSSSEMRRLPVVLDRLENAGVLTMAEAKGFPEQGGMVRLLTEDDHIRFEINIAAAERAHLKISARVMALAAAVLRDGNRQR